MDLYGDVDHLFLFDFYVYFLMKISCLSLPPAIPLPRSPKEKKIASLAFNEKGKGFS